MSKNRPNERPAMNTTEEIFERYTVPTANGWIVYGNHGEVVRETESRYIAERESLRLYREYLRSIR